MPSTPTSKAQVQAYKFVLRRMQSALIRRDPVMMHDPMRTHSRAMVVGAALAAVALAGFAVYGLLDKSPTLPGGDNQIVLSKESGQLYVLSKAPDGSQLLTPTFNLASARLLIMARTQKNSPSQGQGQSGAPAAPASQSAPPNATEVDDSQLNGVTVGRLTGIPDGPSLLPSGDNQQATSKWAVCDSYARDPDLVNPTSQNDIQTTAIAGVDDLGATLPDNGGFLVQAPNGRVYLIYRTPTSLNQPEADAVRAEVNLGQAPIAQTFNGGNKTVTRKISSGLLNAIPSVDGLVTQTVADQGQPLPQSMSSLGGTLKIGDVFKVKPATGEESTYLIQNDGIQDVTESASVANVIEYASSGGSAIQELSPNQITNIPRSSHPNNVKQFPKTVPTLIDQNVNPVMCLGWNPNTSDPDQPKEHTVITIGKKLPIPGSAKPVAVGTPNADGQKIDGFYMPAGKASFIHSAQSPAQFGNGPMYVISDRGVRYGIPDSTTAAGLGLTNAAAAPDSIVRLLPSGAQLDTKSVLRTFDTAPSEGGTYPSTDPNQASANNAPGGG